MLLSALYFILALLLLVLFHELGHFSMARLCGVKVIRFSFGFGKRLLSCFDKSGTEYSLSLVPLGGYVKMLDASCGPIAAADSNKVFDYKPFWARSLIVLAGPLFNFLLAWLLICVVLMLGSTSPAPIIGEVAEHGVGKQIGLQSQHEILAVDEHKIKTWQEFNYLYLANTAKLVKLSMRSADGLVTTVDIHPDNKQDFFQQFSVKPLIPPMPLVVAEVFANTPASAAGLQSGDQIINVNSVTVENWQQLLNLLTHYKSHHMQMQVLRDNHKLSLNIQFSPEDLSAPKVALGIKSQPLHYPDGFIRSFRYSPLSAAYWAYWDMVAVTKGTIVVFKDMLLGAISVKNLSGPVGIAQGVSDSAHMGLESYLTFLALLSIGLGVVNLLPIPLLDGGHLLFLLTELVLRRPLSQNVKIKGTVFGIVLLFALMMVALANDLTRLFGWG